MLGSADIATMLADLMRLGGAVAVTLGATTTPGILEHEGMEVLEGEMPGVIAADKAVRVQSGVLAGLVSGASITVGGTAYKVLKVLPYGDGGMTRVLLRTP